MDYTFQILKATRTNFLNLINGLSLDAVNAIPAGFNNNIIWNFGHIIAAQQVLCYKMSQVTPRVEEEIITKYQKGTKPTAYVSQAELELLKSYLFSTIDFLAEDFENNIFRPFTPYKTSLGSTVSSIEGAIQLLPMHDGLHLGYAMALRKLVQK
ncbi:DinB family protein [Adhaeribacter aquaticus]|uniref:DinB family protein n=1 Tax=Adhaeribacter aquaticus TaxID=299567 RepID=UPI00040A9FC2|nr:DinB family protein [Adhaeribacter aquaticus]